MLRFALFLLAVCLSLPAFGRSAEDARKELNSTLSAIRESNAREKELARHSARLSAELKKLQQEMVAMGDATQRQEEDLSSHEDKLTILEDQKRQKLQAFSIRQAELSSMLSAMVKLHELPPEAIIAMPGKLGETLETARALSLVTHAIEEESQSLKAQLHELDLLEDKIRHNREAVAGKRVSLARRESELAAKMKERSALVEKLGGEEREERERIASLTAKSQNLQELVESLQKSEYGWFKRRGETAADSGQDKKGASHKLRSFTSARGRIRMPAAGRIASRYGESGGPFTKGIVIETRASADVVAPFDGEVVFAGPFRDYGRIVIIRHSGGDYHTLLSGMDEIDCKPGQYLIEGEPIGSMGDEGNTRLYLELREEGRPIDPAGWIKG